jgi:hypothetical protein
MSDFLENLFLKKRHIFNVCPLAQNCSFENHRIKETAYVIGKLDSPVKPGNDSEEWIPARSTPE